MSSKHTHLWNVIGLIAVVLTTQGFCASDINNGGFELFELYEFNDVLKINVPTGWQHENFTAVISNFIPSGQWLLPEEGLVPFEGNSFVVLSTGNVNPEPNYARIWQTITVNAGDKLTGVYFFGTYDYLDFNDFAEIKLVPSPNEPNISEISIMQIAVSDIGNYKSLAGWKRFEYIFDTNQAGTYDLVILVSDYQDYYYNTFLAVDGIVLCHDPPKTGDLNCDCTVDFKDFSLLAADWLCNCNDPNVYNDPNGYCLLGTDLTGDGPVDIHDLRVMSEYWLEGTKEE